MLNMQAVGTRMMPKLARGSPCLGDASARSSGLSSAKPASAGATLSFTSRRMRNQRSLKGMGGHQQFSSVSV
jgi:hypothetical protein